MHQKNNKRSKQKRHNLRRNVQKLQKRKSNNVDDSQVVDAKPHGDIVQNKTRIEACKPAANVHNDFVETKNTRLLDEKNVNRFYLNFLKISK